MSRTQVNIFRHFLQTWLKPEIALDIFYRFGNSVIIYLILCGHFVLFLPHKFPKNIRQKKSDSCGILVIVVVNIVIRKHFII